MASPKNPPPAGSPVPAASPASPETTPFVLTLPDDPASGKDWYLWAGVLVLMVLVAFFPAAWGKFLWDDDHHATAPVMSRPDGLAAIWTQKGATRQWYPLTFSTFWIDNRLYGAAPDDTLGFHLENILLHAGSAILLWRLLRRLRVPLPWVVAGLWAIHPLQAESVCWISERKNVLSGLLFIGSLWFFVDYADLIDPKAPPSLRLKNKPLAYGLSLLLFTLAMLAKTAVCAMPAVALALLWWKRKDLKKVAIWLGLAPFFAVGIVLSAVTIYFETAPGGTEQASGPDYALSNIDRLLIAARGLWFYVAKLIWPVNLSFSYPQVKPGFEGWLYVLTALGVVAACWVWRDRIGRGSLVAVVTYGLLLFPSLGFFNIYPMRYTYVADHYQYLSGAALIALAVAGVRELFIWAGKGKPATSATPSPWPAGVAGFVLLILTAQAWVRAGVYKDGLTLWTDTYKRNDSSWMARDNLGTEYLALASEAEKNARDLQTPEELARQDMADVTADYQQAEDLFKQALVLRPNSIVSLAGLAAVYIHAGNWKGAEDELALAVKNEPLSPSQQDPSQFIDYAQVLAHNHSDMDVSSWFERGLSLADQPRVSPTAIARGEIAYGRYLFSRGVTRPADPDWEEQYLADAADHLNAGLRVLPDRPEDNFALALVYRTLTAIERSRAATAQKVGNLQLVDDFSQKAASYDAMEWQALKKTILGVPNGRHARALAVSGQWLMNHVADYNDQSDVIHQLGEAVQAFIDAHSVDPAVNPSADLKTASAALIVEGQKDLRHPSLWVEMKTTLDQLLVASNGNGAAALDQMAPKAESLTEDVLWPLPPQGHPLRDPLGAVKYRLREYISSRGGPDAASQQAVAALHAATKTAIDHWPELQQVHDDITDANMAVACFQLALKADPHSAVAYNDLAQAANVLELALTKEPQSATGQNQLALARQALDDYRAATQPTTIPATTPSAP